MPDQPTRDQTSDGADRGERNSLDLDSLAVSDRFRLFNFTRRDDHVAYLWVLRALDRLRAVHQVQAHTDDVAAALAELAAVHDEVPRLDGDLREKLDALAEDGMVHRLEDASRAGSLARYRNRQSVYQFSELGYRAFAAVEDVLAARIRDANLSRLVFSDILDDLKALAAATSAEDAEQVYRRLSRLDTVLDDMSRRAAAVPPDARRDRPVDRHLAGDVPAVQERPAHPHDRLHGRARPLPAPAGRGGRRGARQPAPKRPDAMLRLAAEADERPFLSHDELLDDWRRRWAALRAWFARRTAPPSDGQRVPRRRAAHRDPRRRLRRHRAAPPGHRGAARRGEPLIPAPPPRRVGVQRAGRGRRLRADVGGVQPAARLGTSASRTTTPSRSPSAPTWWDAPGVEISVTLFRRGKAAGARRPAARPVQPGGQGRAAAPPGRRARGRARGRAPAPRGPARTTGCSTTPRPRCCCAC